MDAWERFMKRRRAAFGAVPAVATVLVTVAAGLAGIGVGPGRAQTQTQTQGEDMEAVVKDYLAKRPREARRIVQDYLLANPDALREAVAELNRRTTAAAINRNAAALYNSGKQVALGNPKGSITLVEFVDYNCGFCRRALDDLLGLLKSDADLKVLLVEFPVLGPRSVEAARVAVALLMQDRSPATHLEFHKRLLAGPGPANKARALAVAAGLGIDVARLEADSAKPEVDAVLEDGKMLARAIGVRGTPAYVICDSLVVGAVGAARLREKIAAVRQTQQASGQRCEFHAFERP
jgi:protein-disulfide isomerase